MPTIERKRIERHVQMGDLFDEMGCHSTSQSIDADGDTVRDVKQFNVKVRTLDWHRDMSSSWHDIEAIRWTKPDDTICIVAIHEDETNGAHYEFRLECAGRHLVYAGKRGEMFEWLYAEDLDDSYEVMTSVGVANVIEVMHQVRSPERLCDLQVANAHAYLSNGILSHNSHALVHFGAEAIKNKLKVTHYTFELSETAIGLRYDSHLTEIPSNEVPLYKHDVLKIEDGMNLGKLIIKGYPTGSASIQTIRAHIERTTLQGHRPDLLLIDYADIMRSTRHYDSPRFELKLIYEELRNLAMDLDIPIWTASQSNRESANSDIVGLENMSEAYGKAMVADVVISLSRKPQEKATGFGRLFIAKNRAGRDGIVFPVKINTATSTIDVTEGADALSLLEAQQVDEASCKDILRKKWAEIKRDATMSTHPLSKSDLTTVEADATLNFGN